MPVITIRGQFGSWAPSIGALIARKLTIDYVDRKIIAGVAERLRQSSQNIEAKELPPSTLLGRIAEVLGHTYLGDSEYGSMNLPVRDIPPDDTHYLSGLEQVITELAEGGSIVIRGRGSQFILKDLPGAFHVLTVAPVALRVKRIMETLNLNEADAKNEIARFDDGNREFVRRYFQADIENPVHYDLVLNTSHFTTEEAASVVVAALQIKGTGGENSPEGAP